MGFTKEDVDKYVSRLEAFGYSEKSETDRGLIIVAAAILDEQAKEILRLYLIGSPAKDKDDPLLGDSRPLGSFASKIELLYRLGLISAGMRKSLDRIRNMRNKAAHGKEKINFDIDPWRNWVNDFSEPIRLAIAKQGVITKDWDRFSSRERLTHSMSLVMLWMFHIVQAKPKAKVLHP